ncbi:MAG: DUF1015 family protein [Sumerlaeia bacterium]
MAEVWPFAGTRYLASENKINLADVICPPYDEVDSQTQDALHELSEFNMVRLVKGRTAASDDDLNNVFTRSSECYRDWKSRNILADEQRKCLYIYEQNFTGPDGNPVRRLGYFALVKLQDFRSGKTRSFELTYDSLKLDRLKLLRNTLINDSPLYVLYKDEEKQITAILEEMVAKKGPTDEFTTADGIQHRLWLVHKKDPILQVHEIMKTKLLFIAHGHHRYETALKYRDEQRSTTGKRDGRQPYDYSLMFLQRAEDDTLFTEPIHRLLARELANEADIEEVLEEIGEFFDLTPFKVDMNEPDKAEKAIEAKLKPSKTQKGRIVMTLPSGKSWAMSLKKDADLNEIIEEEMMSQQLKEMDVVLLHHFIIPRGWIGNPEVELGEDDICYTTKISEGLDLLQRRKSCVGFFMNDISKDQALQVAENGELLPHRSVNFFPKIPSGLVIRDLNVGFG